MSKPRTIEKVKDFSLVVLFLSTVLLLYFFWGNISLDGFRTPSQQITGEIPDMVDLIEPEQIIVNFGMDNYTVVTPGDIWYNLTEESSFVEELGRFGPAENILVEEIPYDKYQKVMSYKSIWAEFNYEIPLADFCSVYNMKKPQSYDVIDSVSAIGYSTADDGKSLYISDSKNQKYYRLVADAKEAGNTAGTEFVSLIDSIASKGYDIYYPIRSLAGENVNNDSLVPLAVETALRNLPFRQETYSYQTEKISALAEQFFGGNFDFVRKITEESGTIIYMYGYGQNVFIANTDGSIEYKEELVGRTEQGFSQALETAVNFIAGHGSWSLMEEASLSPYLKGVGVNPGKGKGYRFLFGMEVNGNRLFYEDGDPITVDVISGQVTYYKRQIINFNPEDIEAVETAASAEEAFSAVNLIAQNYKHIYEILHQTGALTATEDPAVMFEDVASLVNSMQTGYYKSDDPEITEIQPAWVVTMKNNTEIYFDLYTAEPIGYSAE